MKRRESMIAIGWTIAGGPLFGTVAWGAPPDAVEVMRTEGDVRTRGADRDAGMRARAGTRVPVGSGLETGPDGRAVVRLGDRGLAVLGPLSRIEASIERETTAWFRHVTGAIYYAFHRIDPTAPRTQVRAGFAVLGIRGTRFLVAETPGRGTVGMRKGSITIEPTEGEFDLRRRAGTEPFAIWKRDFRASVAREQDAFRRYAEETRRAFGEYVRTFTLDAGRQAVIDGQRVEERPLDEDTERELLAAESFAAEWLDTVRD